MSDSSPLQHYIRIKGKVLGPFSLEQLRTLQSRGRFHAEHEISVDRRHWHPAASLAELFGTPEASRLPSKTIDVESVASTDRSSESEEFQWHYAVDQKQHGPVTFHELKRLAAAGVLRGKDLVWHSGLENWKTAGEITDLLPAPRSRSTTKRISNQALRDDAQTWLVGGLLRFGQELFSELQMQKFAGWILRLGGYFFTLSSLMVPVIGVILSVRSGSFSPMVLGGIGFLGIAALKYFGLHSLRESEALIQATPQSISSVFPLQMMSLLLVLLSLLGGLELIEGANFSWDLEAERVEMITVAALLAVQLLTAFMILNPKWMNVEVEVGVASRAGREGISILACLIRVFVRLSGVLFMVFASVAFIELSIGAFQLLVRGNTVLDLGGGDFLFPAGITHLMIAGVAPLMAYFMLTMGSIFLDVCQSIITLGNSKDSDHLWQAASQSEEESMK